MAQDNIPTNDSHPSPASQANEGTGKRPILENNSDGAAAWLHRDKNGNAYLSVKLPLGLGSLNLFPSNDTVEDALNQLADHLEDQNQ